MKKLWVRLSIVLPVLAFLTVYIFQTPVLANPTPSSDFSSIDYFVQSQMNSMRIPGVALGIIHDGEIVHLRAFGSADSSGRAVTPQTPFVIGSTSKSFTALAVMQLVESGKIGLDAPIRQYIPWFKLADPEQITVRQLLNQDSGIPTVAGEKPLFGPETSLKDQVRSLQSVHLASTPGTKFAYSNMNYEVLGLLVETVSGQSYGEYIQQHIFTPLKMAHSFTSFSAAKQQGLASGNQYWFGIPETESPQLRADFQPAGWLISSAEDLTHYLIAMMNQGNYAGVSILSPEGVSELEKPAVQAPSLGTGSYYAMGWYRSIIDNQQVIGHDGATNDMHSILIMLPDSKYGVVMLFNAESWLNDQYLGKFDGIGFTIAGMLNGQAAPPADRGFLSPYQTLDLILFLVTMLQIRALIRLIRPKPMMVVPPSTRLAAVRMNITQRVWPVFHDLVLPLIMLLYAPLQAGRSWITLMHIDLYAWIMGYSLLLLATAAVRYLRPWIIQHGKIQNSMQLHQQKS